ncbi:class I SAM-dependent methyltransferase [Streptomyces sp. NPDC006879]|uniref:class I SAM-dependent methyltransferase n=1 Tax=Streptomyces sp. NPDC006879 TaxID=3364767 RepID=UPI0036C62438
MGDDRARVQEFFGTRAADWDARFPEDEGRYEEAVADLDLRAGDRVLDAGCGTGRALPALRSAVGPKGLVIGLDLTPDMLHAAARAARGQVGFLLLGDVAELPLRTGSIDLVFAAGLLSHLHAPEADLRELSRVVRPGGRLALFHPIGRAALAARHGRRLTPEDLRAEQNLREVLRAAGWLLTAYTDQDTRFLALATRQD